MQDLEASDGVAAINANTTITATRMGRPVFNQIQPVAPAQILLMGQTFKH
jgi:hypothetical protein